MAWSDLEHADRGMAPVSSSGARSRAFYGSLGATALASRTTPAWDRLILAALLELLPPSGRILDVGCGYGRIAIPLAAAGYDVTGMDISPNLVRAARRDAAERGVRLQVDRGDMTALAYPDGTYDAVICLWSAFHELLDRDEQVRALRGIRRVLRPAAAATGGGAIIEGPDPAPATATDLASGRRHGPDARFVVERINGRRLDYVLHDATSLRSLALAAGIPDLTVEERSWGGRTRQLIRFGPPLEAAAVPAGA